MKRFGLIGYPLGHTFSPRFFQEKFKEEQIDASYDAIEIDDLANLESSIDFIQYAGLNVTIPHKQSIIQFLDELSPDADAIGAVNCIETTNGKKIGHNTDWIGFRDSIHPLLNSNHTSALILGSGGSSRAVHYALASLDISVNVVSRSGDLSYDNLSIKDIQAHHIIVNTTPLGMHPNIESMPSIPYAALSDLHIVYDLVYNPELTSFLKNGQNQGAVIKNGKEMLARQAEASWNIWNHIG